MAGAFWQPSAVLADTETLKTLPAVQRSDGKAEIIKYAVLGSEKLFRKLELEGKQEEFEKQKGKVKEPIC